MEELMLSNRAWRVFAVVMNVLIGTALSAASAFCVFYYVRGIYRLANGLNPFGGLKESKVFAEPVTIRPTGTGH